MRRGEEGRGGSSPVLLTKMAHVGLSLGPREVHQKQPLDLTHLRFESRSRNVTDSFNHSQNLIKVFHSISPKGKRAERNATNDLHVQYRHGPPRKCHLSGPNAHALIRGESNKDQTWNFLTS